MGWKKEVMQFASSNFKHGQHRDVEHVSPQLFPNDLQKLVSYLTECPRDRDVTTVSRGY